MKARLVKRCLKDRSSPGQCRILILTGARQTGKTTLARMSFPDFAYIAVDDPVMRIQYSSMNASQWHNSFPSAVLDEVQKAPSLIESIKSAHDQYPGTRYVLTGSSQLLLLNKVRESLAGRCAIFEIFPLTIPEILTSAWEEEIRHSFFQSFLETGVLPEYKPSFSMEHDFAKREEAFRYYLYNGAYPALIDPALNDDSRYEWLKDYVRTYLERDVRDLADFRSLEPFVKLQKMTSLITGNLVNYSTLARSAGVSIPTIRRFINYLELSYQVILLPSWSRNISKRLVKSPKLHYLDPGVQKAIIQKRGMPAGNEFESAVVGEIYKQTQSIQYPVSYFHLRTADGREVDLLLETERGYIAIEIKTTGKVATPDARHLKDLDSILDKPLIQAFILSEDPVTREISDKILAIPAAMFLS